MGYTTQEEERMKRLFALIIGLLLLAPSLFAIQDEIEKIQALGDIGVAYDDISVKLPSDDLKSIEALGDLGVLYDAVDKENKYDTAAQVSEEIAKIYAKAGLGPAGFKVSRTAWIILGIIIAGAAIFFLVKSGKLAGILTRSKEVLYALIIRRFTQSKADVHSIMGRLNDNRDRAEINLKVAKDLSRLVDEDKLIILKNKEERKRFEDKMSEEVGKLNDWVKSIQSFLNTTLEIGTVGTTYIKQVEGEVLNEEELLKSMDKSLFTSELNQKIKKLQDATAEEKKKLLATIKSAEGLNFAIGHLKDIVSNELIYIEQEKKAFRDLIKAVKNSKKGDAEDAVKAIGEKAKKIAGIFIPADVADKELHEIETDLGSVLVQYEALNRLDLDRMEAETIFKQRDEKTEEIVDNLVKVAHLSRQNKDQKKFQNAMASLFVFAQQSKPALRIELVKHGVKEDEAKQMVEEFVAAQ
jgi:hypothetical protein